MKNTDYIIVGSGYAALFFAHQLIRQGKEFLLFSDGRKSASQVSAGIINPVVLKKFTTFWKAQEQIDSLVETLTQIECYTGKNFLVKESIHRIFHDENEKNLWQKKASSEELKPFLNLDFVELNNLKNPFGAGKVGQSARLDINSFFSEMLKFFEENGNLIRERFDYDLLNPERNIYNDSISFNKIIFAEGMAVKENLYFNQIPLNPNKGHHLKVKPDGDFEQKITVKKKHFFFPLSDDEFYYGGTYDRDSQTETIDDSAILQLENGLKEFFPGQFEITEKNFGFRPTVKDRRPILGQHHKFKNLYVFNGLGARGILNGNYFSKVLFDFAEKNIPLPDEVNMNRFE